MLSMIPFRRKTHPPVIGSEEQVEVGNTSGSAKKKKPKEGKPGNPAQPQPQPLPLPSTKKTPIKHLFGSVTTSYTQPQSTLAFSVPSQSQ